MATNEGVLNESILDSIKKLLGINAEVTAFDQEIAIHINTVFSELAQMGIGPEKGYMITGPANTWSEFCKDDFPLLSNVKTYIYLKVRLLFALAKSSSDIFSGFFGLPSLLYLAFPASVSVPSSF